MSESKMKIEIWSDVVCPWCYIGKRRFEEALRGFDRRDEVDVVWRSFQLDQAAARSSESKLTSTERLAQKYGVSHEQAQAMNARVTGAAAEEGLEYHLDKAQSANTFDAHRLSHFAAVHGMQDAMEERLMRAYFTEGEVVDDLDTLVRLASEIGLDEAAARQALESGAFADDVRADLRRARTFGISGVPFFAIDERYGISGAQPAEFILRVLEEAWAEAHPLLKVTPSGSAERGAACEGDACTVG